MPLNPIPFTSVSLNDIFWAPRLESNRTITIPHVLRMCRESGRFANFARAGGLEDGPHQGIFYDDSDVFKVIEGAAATLAARPDPELEAVLDGLIELIAAAQEADDYLYTARSIDPGRMRPDAEGLERWSNLRSSHELYNVGHLYEAAVIHFRATGKRRLLEVALKNAELIMAVFGPHKKRDVPGHQEIEIGLLELYRLTGERRYLDQARFFLDERGRAHGRPLYGVPGIPGYMQDHLPLTEQREAVGHAVRFGYLAAAMADMAVFSGDPAYTAALNALWLDVTGRKLYLTGGVGAMKQGEAFGEPYELPNETAYCETCAAIANALWQQRMFLLHGKAQYIDVLERILYNGFLAGVSLGGDRFFYANPLTSDEVRLFNAGQSATRLPWFRTACCPSNMVRFMPRLPGFFYAVRRDELFTNLYAAGRADIELKGRRVVVRQETAYPWEGRVRLVVEPEVSAVFTLRLRLPGWARGQPVPGDLYCYLDQPLQPPRLRLNGRPVPIEEEDGYACLRRTWRPGDVVELDLPLAIRRVASHGQVAANHGRLALERGPLVYCVEGVDNGGQVEQLSLPPGAALRAEVRPDFLGGVTVIRGDEPPLLAIPYYAWSNRGSGPMAVWLPF